MTRYEPHCDCLGGHVSMVPDPNGRWCRADDPRAVADDSPSGPCPICRGTGIARSAPYMMGLAQGDLYTMTVCSCLSGKRVAAEINEKVKKP